MDSYFTLVAGSVAKHHRDDTRIFLFSSFTLLSLSNHFKCTIEGDSSWFHLLGRNLNQLVSLQVRSRVTQRCPRRVSYQIDKTGVFHRCPAGLVLVRWPRDTLLYESRAPQRSNAR